MTEPTEEWRARIRGDLEAILDAVPDAVPDAVLVVTSFAQSVISLFGLIDPCVRALKALVRFKRRRYHWRNHRRYRRNRRRAPGRRP